MILLDNILIGVLRKILEIGYHDAGCIGLILR